jgi:hypothetical protein
MEEVIGKVCYLEEAVLSIAGDFKSTINKTNH